MHLQKKAKAQKQQQTAIFANFYGISSYQNNDIFVQRYKKIITFRHLFTNVKQMINFPTAKINIGLNVVSKRADGFHNLESVFYPVPFCDALEIVPSDAQSHLSIYPENLALGEVEKNLVWRAYRLLANDYVLPNIAIKLLKHIPAGAGLGGGSSDAVFMLKLLNEYANLQLSNEKMMHYALQLGSDCPFFLDNTPKKVRGRGEVLENCALSLNGYFLALICLPIHISTAEAFQGIVPQIPSENLFENVQKPIETWKNKIFNDFEKTVFLKHPILADIKEKLYQKGALYASMSGTGSSIYGIFEEEPDVKIAGAFVFSCAL